MVGHSGHSALLKTISSKYDIIIASRREGEKSSTQNNREVAMSTLSAQQEQKPQNISDPRFNSPAFRDAVRIVLTYFGYENPTIADFKTVEAKFSGRINWLEFAKRRLQPRYDAVVFVLTGSGHRVFNSRGYVKKCVTLFGSTRDEALSKLDTKSYEFDRCFDFPKIQQKNSSHDAPGCDVADLPDVRDGQNLDENKKITNVNV